MKKIFLLTIVGMGLLLCSCGKAEETKGISNTTLNSTENETDKKSDIRTEEQINNKQIDNEQIETYSKDDARFANYILKPEEEYINTCDIDNDGQNEKIVIQGCFYNNQDVKPVLKIIKDDKEIYSAALNSFIQSTKDNIFALSIYLVEHEGKNCLLTYHPVNQQIGERYTLLEFSKDNKLDIIDQFVYGYHETEVGGFGYKLTDISTIVDFNNRINIYLKNATLLFDTRYGDSVENIVYIKNDTLAKKGYTDSINKVLEWMNSYLGKTIASSNELMQAEGKTDLIINDLDTLEVKLKKMNKIKEEKDKPYYQG